MYAALWRHLPGPPPVKAVLAVALVLACVLVLFNWVFPWIEPRLPFGDVTVTSLTLCPALRWRSSRTPDHRPVGQRSPADGPNPEAADL